MALGKTHILTFRPTNESLSFSDITNLSEVPLNYKKFLQKKENDALVFRGVDFFRRVGGDEAPKFARLQRPKALTAGAEFLVNTL